MAFYTKKIIFYTLVLLIYIVLLIISEKSVSQKCKTWNENRQIWFFTTWNMCFHIIYILMGILEQLLPNNAKLQSLNNRFFFSVTFPSSFFVFTIFWSLYVLDPHFVMPPELVFCLSIWVNHIFHTWILVLPLLEIIFLQKNYNADYKIHLKDITVIFILYYICFFYQYLYHGIWLYKIHGMLVGLSKVLFILTQYIVFITYGFVGVFWQKQYSQLKHKYM